MLKPWSSSGNACGGGCRSQNAVCAESAPSASRSCRARSKPPSRCLRGDASACTVGLVFLAGVDVPDRAVLDLARRLRNAEHVTLADKLEDAWRANDSTIALETQDREALLTILDDAPAELTRLHSVLLQEHERKLGGGH